MGEAAQPIELPGLDPEMSAYVHLVDSFYPPDAVDLDIAGQRAVYDRMCAVFTRPLPRGVIAENSIVTGRDGPILIRRYHCGTAEGRATIVYFHGGGFVVGGLDSHDSVCAELCVASTHRVVAVDYRLAPEHSHPAHFHDALDAFRAIAAEGRPVVVAGDSAGGNLAAAVALASREGAAAPIGQFLIYPGLGGEALDLPSYAEHAEAIHLTARDVAYYRRIRAGVADPSASDWTFAPLMAPEFAALPPCLAFSAAIDPLRDDAAEWVRRLRGAGISATHVNEPGLVHGYLRARLMSARAQAAFDRICQAARRLGDGMA